MIIISARLFSDDIARALEPPRAIHTDTEVPLRTACAILVVSNPYRHGIDFKNPFTMSKRVVSTQHHRALARRTVSLHPWNSKAYVEIAALFREAPRTADIALAMVDDTGFARVRSWLRLPSRCAVSRSVAAPCGALRSAGRPRFSKAEPADWWSLSGSNR